MGGRVHPRRKKEGGTTLRVAVPNPRLIAGKSEVAPEGVSPVRPDTAGPLAIAQERGRVGSPDLPPAAVATLDANCSTTFMADGINTEADGGELADDGKPPIH